MQSIHLSLTCRLDSSLQHAISSCLVLASSYIARQRLRPRDLEGKLKQKKKSSEYKRLDHLIHFCC